MDVGWLEEFAVLAECLSYTEAARRLAMTQPGLSRHISSLERELGVRLFERNSHGVSLTEVGRSLLDDAREMTALEKRILSKAHRGCTLRVGGAGLMLSVSSIIKPALDRMEAENTLLAASCEVTYFADYRQRLEDGEFDAVVCGMFPGEYGGAVAADRLFEEPLILCVPTVDRAEQAPGRLADLEGWTFRPPCTGGKHEGWIGFCQGLFEAAGVRILIGGPHDDRMRLGPREFAITVESSFPMGDWSTDVRFVPLPDVTMPVGLMYLRANDNPALARFRELAKAAAGVR